MHFFFLFRIFEEKKLDFSVEKNIRIIAGIAGIFILNSG